MKTIIANMTYLKINDMLYPAKFCERERDALWDYRNTKSITVDMSYEDAKSLFMDDVDWSIVYQEDDYMDGNGEMVTPEPVVYDNSDYSVSGPITDNRDGTVTVKMGKITDSEALAELREALNV